MSIQALTEQSRIEAGARRAAADGDATASPEVSIITPTYCEAENLRVLAPAVFEALATEGLDAELIVVDDDSPDATAAACSELAERFPLRLEVRKGERGLSGAVVHGLRLARGNVLVVMDADLSHPPATVPALVRALRDPQVDLVLGSRYAPGGATDEQWGVFRRLNSRVATLLARPLTDVADPMAGFFAFRRERFRKHAGALDPIGYKIALECIVKCECRNVVEIPITFRNRLHGRSKLSLREQWNYLRHVARLIRWKARSKRCNKAD